MRTKAREGFSKALRDAHRWLDELLFDPTQTIESLAARESKSEGFVRVTAGRQRVEQLAQAQAAIRPRGCATLPMRQSVSACTLGG